MFTKILLSVFVSLIWVLPASAFGISPVKLLITADSNNSQTVTIQINNSENTDTVFNLGVWGVTQNNEGYPNFGRGVTEAEAWVFPESNSMLIKTKQSEKANFIIRIPEKTQPGSYYVGLFVEPQLGVDNKSGVSSRLISLLTIQVAGAVYEEILIDTWRPKNGISTDKKWDFDLNLRNNGPVEVNLKGLLAVRNWRGEEIFAEGVGLGNKLIAGSRRNLSTHVSEANKIIWPGLYQAQIRISYGLTGQKANSLAYIWYLPVWSFVVLGILVLLLISAILSLRKRKK